MSAAAQIIHVLRKSDAPMDSHAIYVATSILDSQTCLNTISNMYNKTVLERDRDDDSKPWLYWIHPRAKVPDRIAAEVMELEKNGLPVVQRHVGPSRAEYMQAAEAKRATKKTTTLTVTNEETCVVNVPASWVADGLVKVSDHAPIEEPQKQQPLSIPAPQSTAILERQEALARRFTDERDAAQAKLDTVYLMQELCGNGGDRLAWLLGDYVEMLEAGGVADEWIELKEHASDARQFAKSAKVFRSGIMDKVVSHLNAYRKICWDCVTDASSNNDDMRDVKEMEELIVMLGGEPDELT